MRTKEPLVVAKKAIRHVADVATRGEAARAETVRDDAELEARINTFLHQRNETPLRQLRVDVCDGCATITGVVRTYYQKQLAGHCCQRVAGVQHVLNNVTVER